MTKSIIITCLLALSLTGPGCTSLVKPEDSKASADHRWKKVRAQLKFQVASDSFERGQLDKAEEALREVVGLYPEYADAYVLLTRLRLEQGETAAASEALEQAIRHGGDSPETDYLSGMIAQRYGRLENALDWYRRASQRSPHEVHYILALAEMLVELDRADEALTFAESRWPDFDNNAALRTLVGKIHVLRGDHANAAEAFRAAHHIDPKDKLVAYDLALSLFEIDAHADARDMLLAAEKLEGKLPVFMRLMLGRCYWSLSEVGSAKEEFRQVVREDPQNTEGWMWLAKSCVATNDLLSARRAAARCHELEPERGEHAFFYGFVCHRQGDDEAAIPLLREAVSRLPEETMAYCLLGQSLQRQSRWNEARECYEKALAIEPEDAYARKLMEALPPAEEPVLEVSSFR